MVLSLLNRGEAEQASRKTVIEWGLLVTERLLVSMESLDRSPRRYLYIFESNNVKEDYKTFNYLGFGVGLPRLKSYYCH